MEQLKVKKKDVIIINSAIYLFLAFLFLYLQHAYRHHLSPFSLTYFQKSAELFWYVAIPVVVSGILLWRHHRWALFAYSLCISLVSFKVVEGLFIEFNKIIVVALFFFVVISYFIYQLLSQYLELASINPNYSRSDLFSPMLRPIPCLVTAGDKEMPGILTNWDEEGCFIKMETPGSVGNKIAVKIQFQGREFIQAGEVVAHSLGFAGIGIKFQKTPKELNVFNWSEFMELIQELGFQPERLR